MEEGVEADMESVRERVARHREKKRRMKDAELRSAQKLLDEEVSFIPGVIKILGTFSEWELQQYEHKLWKKVAKMTKETMKKRFENEILPGLSEISGKDRTNWFFWFLISERLIGELKELKNAIESNTNAIEKLIKKVK